MSGTYATSSQVLPAVQRRKAPVLILNLQPVASDGLSQHRYGGVAGELLRLLCAGNFECLRARRGSNSMSCPVCWPAGRARRQPICDSRMARDRGVGTRGAVLRELSYSRIGFLGHTYPGMLDMYSDFTMHHAQLGAHIEVLEMDDLQTRVKCGHANEIAAKIEEIQHSFQMAEKGSDKISQPVTRGRAALVGAGGLRAGSAGGGFRPERADLLLSRLEWQPLRGTGRVA